MIDFVQVNGANLAYRLCGPDKAPLIITLHGGRGMGKTTFTSTVYRTQANHHAGDHKSDFKIYSQLSDNYRVLSFDFRGHGQSSRTKPYTFSQLVDDIEGIRTHFAGPEQQAIICGGSFGGFLAQHYAIKYAARVSHLILRGTAPSHHRKLPVLQHFRRPHAVRRTQLT